MNTPLPKKLIFYCERCGTYRIMYEPDNEKIFTKLDRIDMNNILSPRKGKELFSENGNITSSPMVKNRKVVEA